jgi:surface polysaccharide O-acyltransferase-like enzyme
MQHVVETIVRDGPGLAAQPAGAALRVEPAASETSSLSKVDFLSYIHRCRGIAILYILLGHCVDAFVWDGSPVGRAVRIVACNGTVLFVFIAGYLFQHLSLRFRIGRYLRTKLLNVVLPYVLWSIPAIVLFTVFAHREGIAPSFYGQPVPLQIGTFLLTGHHLTAYWFIPMICVFYLAAPVLLLLDRAKWGYAVLPILILLSCYVSRGGNLAVNFTHFLSIYVLGMFCSHYRREIARLFQRGAWIGGLLVAAAGLAAAEYLFITGTGGWTNLLQKLCVCAALVLWLPRYAGTSMRPLEYLANISFALYFAHPYLMGLYKMSVLSILHRDTLPNGSLPWFAVFCVLFVAACAGLVALAKWIFGRYSRPVIGS